jgi:D-alanine--poly(phosphoribitol) ligase subunit 1
MNWLSAQVLEMASWQPDHAAVLTDDRTVSYGAFAARIRQIAAALATQFAQSDHHAAVIFLPQGPDAYAAMFATLMAGGFYVPLNVSAPAQKLAAIVSQIDPAVIVTDEEWKHLLPQSEVPVLTLRSLDQSTLDDPRPPHRLAYVMFTSGSTGAPKGVMVSQEALAHYVEWIGQSIRPTPDDRWSQHPNIAFDLSVLDVYGALSFGATLCPLYSESARLLPAQWLRNNRITIWNSVPSVISLMMRANQVKMDFLSTVRLFTFCGEPLLPEHVEALFAAVPGTTIQNTYGPTEATVSCTELRMTRDTWRSHARNTLALGQPIPGMEVLLDGPETPFRGELVIVGPQVADGYWNDPQQTEAGFRTMVQEGEVRRAYFTGDIVERLGNDLYFQARRDRQVKITGYRVELDDVNAVLRRCGYIHSSVAMIGNTLHGFVETGPKKSFDVGALKKAMLQHLDLYAIPAHFHAFEHLPRSANDKLDVQAMIRSVLVQPRKNEL